MKRAVWDRPDLKVALDEPIMVVFTVGQLCVTFAALADAEREFAAVRGEYPYPEIAAALARVSAALEGAAS